jgi:hypothetical protein
MPRVSGGEEGRRCLTTEEARDIIDEYEEWESESCHCSTCGFPPCSHCENSPASEEDYDEAIKLIEQFEKENEPMNQIIIDMYPATKDAVLIQKWFGERIASEPLFAILLKGKEAEILDEAKKLEKEEAANRLNA